MAYLWARTAECGDCRAEIPLLKTRWLCKRDTKRVVLTMTPRENRSGVDFGVESFDPTPPEPAPPATLLEGHQIQDLAEFLPELMEASAGHQLKFRVQVVLEDAPPEIRDKVDQLIDSRLKAEPNRSS